MKFKHRHCNAPTSRCHKLESPTRRQRHTLGPHSPMVQRASTSRSSIASRRAVSLGGTAGMHTRHQDLATAGLPRICRGCQVETVAGRRAGQPSSLAAPPHWPSVRGWRRPGSSSIGWSALAPGRSWADERQDLAGGALDESASRAEGSLGRSGTRRQNRS